MNQEVLMPFALVNTVRIEDVETARKGLHADVIPGVKQAPGFLRGIWSADREGGRGIGVMVFETRQQAEMLMQQQKSGQVKPAPGVTFEDVGVYEVVGEA